jgi:hypothetical protein
MTIEPVSLDLFRLTTEVESGYGSYIRGIDLGSVRSDHRGMDASDYRIGLASLVQVAPGWREVCHAVATGSGWSRSYYVGMHYPAPASLDAGEHSLACSNGCDRLRGPCCDLCGDCRAAEQALGRTCCTLAETP